MLKELKSEHPVSQPGHLHTPCLYSGVIPSSIFTATGGWPIIAPGKYQETWTMNTTLYNISCHLLLGTEIWLHGIELKCYLNFHIIQKVYFTTNIKFYESDNSVFVSTLHVHYLGQLLYLHISLVHILPSRLVLQPNPDILTNSTIRPAFNWDAMSWGN